MASSQNQSIQNLAEFIQIANKNTYAADLGNSISSKQDSIDLIYKEGDWIYHDTYFGNRNYIGEEIIYFQNNKFWGMNYYGFVLDDLIDHKILWEFLKQCLLQNSGKEILPVRGPKEYKNNVYTYKNTVDGDLQRFRGEEKIYENQSLIYQCYYHGGLIK